MAITYILFSHSKKQFYVGSSRLNDSSNRLSAHNKGKVQSTKSGRPWIEVATEQFAIYTDARKREIFLKSGAGREWIKKQFGHLKQP